MLLLLLCVLYASYNTYQLCTMQDTTDNYQHSAEQFSWLNALMNTTSFLTMLPPHTYSSLLILPSILYPLYNYTFIVIKLYLCTDQCHMNGHPQYPSLGCVLLLGVQPSYLYQTPPFLVLYLYLGPWSFCILDTQEQPVQICSCNGGVSSHSTQAKIVPNRDCILAQQITIPILPT